MPDQQAEFAADWADWEQPLFDVADSHGLDPVAVRGLRDSAMALGQEIGKRGRPASDDELVAVFNRLKVPASARADLVRLWRSFESGGG